MTYKTYSQKPSEVSRKWVLIDASEAPLGRVAVVISKYLVGKYKSDYTPHIDGGDFVVVINAEKTVLTGDKEDDKTYYRHTGYPGGIKAATAREVREKHPHRLIEKAVKGMLPKNKLASERMQRLKIYAGDSHEHAAQKPQKVEVR